MKALLIFATFMLAANAHAGLPGLDQVIFLQPSDQALHGNELETALKPYLSAQNTKVDSYVSSAIIVEAGKVKAALQAVRAIPGWSAQPIEQALSTPDKSKTSAQIIQSSNVPLWAMEAVDRLYYSMATAQARGSDWETMTKKAELVRRQDPAWREARSLFQENMQERAQHANILLDYRTELAISTLGKSNSLLAEQFGTNEGARSAVRRYFEDIEHELMDQISMAQTYSRTLDRALKAERLKQGAGEALIRKSSIQVGYRYAGDGVKDLVFSRKGAENFSAAREILYGNWNQWPEVLRLLGDMNHWGEGRRILAGTIRGVDARSSKLLMQIREKEVLLEKYQTAHNLVPGFKPTFDEALTEMGKMSQFREVRYPTVNLGVLSQMIDSISYAASFEMIGLGELERAEVSMMSFAILNDVKDAPIPVSKNLARLIELQQQRIKDHALARIDKTPILHGKDLAYKFLKPSDNSCEGLFGN